MTKLEEALEVRQILKQDIKETEREIKELTSSLQENLKKEKKKLKEHNKIFEELAKDKNEHILDRAYIWINYVKKDIADWVLDEGPLMEYIFDDEYRHSTIDVVDRLIDYIAYFTEDIEGFEDEEFVSIGDKDKDNLELFNRLPKEDREKLTSILEDAIEQNKSEFTYDW
jgi:hypothetical protein